jgi:hypothetical protein
VIFIIVIRSKTASIKQQSTSLESKLVEEVLNTDGLSVRLGGLVLVFVLEDLLDSLAGLHTLVLSDSAFIDDLLQVNVDRVSGGKNVVVVEDLDEGLHLGALLELLLAHGADDLAGVSVDTGNCTADRGGEAARLDKKKTKKGKENRGVSYQERDRTSWRRCPRRWS